MTGWPQKNVPPEYLQLAQKLINRQTVTRRQFVELCLLAVKYIDGDITTIWSRSDMALYIANLWLRQPNLNIDLLDDIGGQFAEWDRPGSFTIEGDANKRRWEIVKTWIFEADKRYAQEHEQDYSEGVPSALLKLSTQLLRQKSVTKQEFLDICSKAVEVIESGQSTLKSRRNVAFYIAEIANRHDNLLDDDLLGKISAKFSAYDLPDSFNFEFILEKHSWEELKLLLIAAGKKYCTDSKHAGN